MIQGIWEIQCHEIIDEYDRYIISKNTVHIYIHCIYIYKYILYIYIYQRGVNWSQTSTMVIFRCHLLRLSDWRKRHLNMSVLEVFVNIIKLQGFFPSSTKTKQQATSVHDNHKQLRFKPSDRPYTYTNQNREENHKFIQTHLPNRQPPNLFFTASD